MGKARKYFLVAKEYCTDGFDIISFSEKNRFNLHEIDNITSNFSSKEELVNYLYSTESIKTKDVDIFIAGLNKDNKLEEYEVIYDDNHEFTKDITKFSNTLIKGDQLLKSDTEGVINKFRYYLMNDNCYKNIVQFGFSNINDWFLDKFQFGNGKLKPNESLLSDGAFIYSDYKLLRNIVDSINTYKRLENQHKSFSRGNDDTFEDIIDIYKNIILKRDEIKDSLTERIMIEDDRKKMDGQISLFENNMILGQQDSEVAENDNDIELLYGRKYSVKNEDFAKLVFIKDTIKDMPSKTISGFGNEYSFNANMFVYYTTEFDKAFLITNFDKKFIELLDLYLITNSKLVNNKLNEDEKEILKIKLNEIDDEITEYLLHNENTFNNALNWCKVYNRNKEYNNIIKNNEEGPYYETKQRILYKYQNN